MPFADGEPDDTIEFKSVGVPTYSAIDPAVRRGRRQSGRVLIDAVSAGVDTDDAVNALRRVVGSRGAGFVAIAILIAMRNPQDPKSEDVIVDWTTP